MSLDSTGITHVGPPTLGSGDIVFEETTKVVAYATIDLTILPWASSSKVFGLDDIKVDTLGEFASSNFYPIASAWYGVGGLFRCKAINLNTYNGRYAIIIYKNSKSVILQNFVWNAAPVSGVTTCEFYNFVYLEAGEDMSFYVTQLSSAPVAIFEGLGPLPSYIYIHRLL